MSKLNAAFLHGAFLAAAMAVAAPALADECDVLYYNMTGGPSLKTFHVTYGGVAKGTITFSSMSRPVADAISFRGTWQLDPNEFPHTIDGACWGNLMSFNTLASPSTRYGGTVRSWYGESRRWFSVTDGTFEMQN